MKARKLYSVNSIKQGVKPEKYCPGLSDYFLIFKLYSDREIRMREQAGIILNAPENTPNKMCQCLNCLESVFCARVLAHVG